MEPEESKSHCNTMPGQRFYLDTPLGTLPASVVRTLSDGHVVALVLHPERTYRGKIVSGQEYVMLVHPQEIKGLEEIAGKTIPLGAAKPQRG